MVMRIDGTTSVKNTRNLTSSSAPKTGKLPTQTFPSGSGSGTNEPAKTGKVSSQTFPGTSAPPPAAGYSDWSVTGSDGITDYGGGGSGGGFGVGGGAGGTMSDQDWLAGGGDSILKADLARLQKILADYKAQNLAEQERYGNRFTDGLVSLGWKGDDRSTRFDPTSKAWQVEGDWDWEDTNYAAGRGVQNTRNDFASRGMLQSADYVRAQDNFKRQLADQKSSMLTSGNEFISDLLSQLAAQEAENTAAENAARQEAVQRYMSGLSGLI